MTDSDRPDTELEEILLQCLEDEDPEAKLAELVEQQPGLAPRARRILGRLKKLKLLDDESLENGGGYSEIPGFRMIRPLGQGGMGEVFLVEQLEPVRREVALKVIRVGMHREELRRRFERERQALALMSHKNIARVFEAGTTPDGMPFLVMEYIAGVPVTEFCDARTCSTRARIELFLDLCTGVQHAHQKGIIHRDLKPANILVKTEGDDSVLKIIDFGIARATDQQLIEQTLFTQHGQVLGTPAYMSPEQAEMSAQEIDTRSDVYSLGVILYELLTGQLPFSNEELYEAGPLGMRRMIVEREPPRPSTRVSTFAQPSNTTKLRQTTRSTLMRDLRSDLDWVVMKSLEKDRTRRYATVQELAADLQRFLDGEPVLATAHGALYRASKFVRRNRVLVFAGVAAVLLLLVGLFVASWQAGVARDNLARARKKGREAVTNLGHARKSEGLAVRKTKETKESLGLANARLADYLRMRDVPLAENLSLEADALWPAHPDKVDRMQVWLESARSLVDRTTIHRDLLEKVRLRAKPLRADVRSTLRSIESLEEKRAKALGEIARARSAAPKSRSARRALPRLERALQAVSKRLRDKKKQLSPEAWQFANYEDSFQHSVFHSLVEKLERFDGEAGLLASITARAKRATTLHDRSIAQQERAWQQAIEAIAQSERYRGTPRITPQLGLLPIGVDPSSELWEFAVLDTGSVPTRNGDGRLQIGADTAIVLVLIPAGSFSMGAQNKDPDGPNYDLEAQPRESKSDGLPVRMQLGAFFLGKYEITQGQWRYAAMNDPSLHRVGMRYRNMDGEPRAITGQHPVDRPTWHECREALRRLGLVLPTEAQWEYAARAGTTTPWWCGANPRVLDKCENLFDVHAHQFQSQRPKPALNDGYPIKSPVGSFRANAFGLHDMLGNVREWCADGYDGRYDDPGRTGDGLRTTANPPARFIRGGSTYDTPKSARCAMRSPYRPTHSLPQNGLRAARRLKP